MTRKTSSKPRDVVTLADLAPARRVTGGSRSRVFGADASASTNQDARVAKKAMRDLPAARNVKGGKIAINDNLTLVRAARATKSR
jgi:hypothetical protein